MGGRDATISAEGSRAEAADEGEESKGSRKHLLGEPGAAGLGDPLPGVDAGVDPDGRTISSSAELQDRKEGGCQILRNKCLKTFFIIDVSSFLLFYLEHSQVAALVALTNHSLAHQNGILSHQHVLELVDLKQQHRVVSRGCNMGGVAFNIPGSVQRHGH